MRHPYWPQWPTLPNQPRDTGSVGQGALASLHAANALITAMSTRKNPKKHSFVKGLQGQDLEKKNYKSVKRLFLLVQLQELTSLLARDAKLGAWSHQGCFQKSAVLRYSVLIKLTGAQVDIIDKSLSECLWRMASEPRAFRASRLYTCSTQTRHALPMWTDHFCSHVLCICTSAFFRSKSKASKPTKKDFKYTSSHAPKTTWEENNSTGRRRTPHNL